MLKHFEFISESTPIMTNILRNCDFPGCHEHMDIWCPETQRYLCFDHAHARPADFAPEPTAKKRKTTVSVLDFVKRSVNVSNISNEDDDDDDDSDYVDEGKDHDEDDNSVLTEDATGQVRPLTAEEEQEDEVNNAAALFSLYESLMTSEQENALEDRIETSIMLRYNERQRQNNNAN